MGVNEKIRRALRGRVPVRAALLEAGRRGVAAVRLRGERAALTHGKSGDAALRARLAPGFERLGGAELLEHFRARAAPRLFAGFEEAESAYLSAKRGGGAPLAAARVRRAGVRRPRGLAARARVGRALAARVPRGRAARARRRV